MTALKDNSSMVARWLPTPLQVYRKLSIQPLCWCALDGSECCPFNGRMCLGCCICCAGSVSVVMLAEDPLEAPRYHPDKNPDEASKEKFAEISHTVASCDGCNLRLSKFTGRCPGTKPPPKLRRRLRDSKWPGQENPVWHRQDSKLSHWHLAS